MLLDKKPAETERDEISRKLDVARRASYLLIAALFAATISGHFLKTGGGVEAAVPAVEVPAAPTSFVASSQGPVRFSGKLDRTSVMTGGDGRVMMELVVEAEERAGTAAARVPTDLVVVLDRSGSMEGEKMVHARAAVRELVSQLGPDDAFALVAYSSGAELAIPLEPATPEARRRWLRTVDAIRPSGGTAMSAGLDLGLGIFAGLRSLRPSRLLLISDGLANEGDATVEGLAGRAARAAHGETVVSTIGVGDDFNEFLMTAVADAGTGNYYYLQDVERLAEVFADELETSRTTVASGLEVTIDAGDGVRVVDAAGYPLERRGSRVTFRPGSLYSGQERRLWVTFAVPRDDPGEVRLGNVRLDFTDGGEARTLAFEDVPVITAVRDETLYYAAIDGEAWARSAAEEDYNRLQTEVARHVREGRREEALAEISAYRQEKERMNLHLQKDEIRRKLEDLHSLRLDVDDAFEGADQAAKQNLLSKARQSAGLDGRRPGSKKSSQ